MMTVKMAGTVTEAAPAITRLTGDCRTILPQLAEEHFQCVITSPPYYRMRDYGVPGQIGLEENIDDWLDSLMSVMDEVWRVLRKDGVLWINIADSYCISRRRADGVPLKSRLALPERLSLAMIGRGWLYRQQNIWAKSNPTPENVADRPSTAHELILMFTRSERYHYNADAVRLPAIGEGLAEGPDCRDVGVQQMLPLDYPDTRPNPPVRRYYPPGAGAHEGLDYKLRQMSKAGQMANGANLRSVWHLAGKRLPGNHPASFPLQMAAIPILSCSRPGDHILDPFAGSGTTGVVAAQYGRNATLVELNEEYLDGRQ